jgi:hypothetical protein
MPEAAAIVRRLEALSDACREVLSVAAVRGAEFAVALLTSVVAGTGAVFAEAEGPAESVARAVAEAQAKGVIQPVSRSPPRYRFTDVSLQAALYERIAPPQRARLHRATMRRPPTTPVAPATTCTVSVAAAERAPQPRFAYGASGSTSVSFIETTPSANAGLSRMAYVPTRV